MKVLSLKLKDDVYDGVERMVQKIKVSRNAYINEALRLYNKFNERRHLRKKMAQESLAVQASTLEVLQEMEKLEDPLPE